MTDLICDYQDIARRLQDLTNVKPEHGRSDPTPIDQAYPQPSNPFAGMTWTGMVLSEADLCCLVLPSDVKASDIKAGFGSWVDRAELS